MSAPIDYLRVSDVTVPQLRSLLEASHSFEADRLTAAHRLSRQSVALVFEKPSTRTRVSFELAVAALGGQPIALDAPRMQFGRGETVEDTARTLGTYVDLIVWRTSDHAALEDAARAATIPVVNALSDVEHPCQAIADVLALQSVLGSLEGKKVAYIGAPNNVALSFSVACLMLGTDVACVSPVELAPPPAFLEECVRASRLGGASFLTTADTAEGLSGACAIYTDVWIGMHEESTPEWERRIELLMPYQVNEKHLAYATRDPFLLHCLPMRRGYEITESCAASPHFLGWLQARYRLPTAMAILDLVARPASRDASGSSVPLVVYERVEVVSSAAVVEREP
jgi:ornithine carbamoyltransferase